MNSSKEIRTANFQKGDEFLLFLLNRGYSQKSINIAIEGVTDFWKRNSELSSSSLLSYRDFLIDNYKPATVNLRIWAINLYTKFLSRIFSSAEDKIIKPSLCIENISPEYNIKDSACIQWFPLLSNIPSSKKQNLENIISLEDYNTIKQYLLKQGKMKELLLVKTLASTGMRPSEVLKVTGADIRRGYVDMKSKRNKTRRIYFTDSLRLALQDYILSLPKECANTFNWNERLFDLDHGQLSYVIKREGAAAGVRPEVLYPYSFRHMFGKMFMSRNTDISLLSDIMGHDSIETTRVYTRMTMDEQRAKINMIVDWC